MSGTMDDPPFWTDAKTKQRDKKIESLNKLILDNLCVIGLNLSRGQADQRKDERQIKRPVVNGADGQILINLVPQKSASESFDVKVKVPVFPVTKRHRSEASPPWGRPTTSA